MADLNESRNKIQEIDKQMAALFEERMKAAKEIGIYKQEHGLRYSDAYEVYGLKRTGCCGCPISYRAVDDLELIGKYEPNVAKAAWNIFGKSYLYRQKYVAYKAERDRAEKEAKKEVQGQCSFEMR